MRADPIYRCRVLVFLKEPHPGRVKTRLGRAIGDIRAAWWCRHHSARLIRRLSSDPRWETWLAVSPDHEGEMSRVWPAHLPRWPQGDGDLGARMGRAFRDLPPGPLAIVGTDIPDLGSAHVAAAFHALGEHDAALGPCPDGGYYLIAMKRTPRRAASGLFDGVRWSSEYAMTDTLASLGRARVALLPELQDVDEAADLAAVRRT